VSDDQTLQREAPFWKTLLSRNDKQRAYGDERNVMIALEHAEEIKSRLQYDAFSDQINVLMNYPWDALKLRNDDALSQRTWGEQDRIELQVWLQQQGIPVARSNTVQDAVIASAHRNPMHPVRDYLKHCGTKWDGQQRITTWLTKYLGAKDNTAYLNKIGPAFLIGAVRRITTPGIQMDTILVLEGDQGARKSSTVRVLSNGWCSDISNDLHSREAAMLIQGVWIGELSELTALARSQVEMSKGFIARRFDKYRPPYARNVVERPRQTVFIATTNEVEYLQDQTGNRRFWPVDCRAIDLDLLARDREQLWGEAYQASLTSQAHYLDYPGELLAWREQEQRRRVPLLEQQVLVQLDQLIENNILSTDMRRMLQRILGEDADKISPQHGALAKEISRVMTANGWSKQRPRGRGKHRVVIYGYDKSRDRTALMSDALDELEANNGS
jgi:putative DNA primase/helicase